MGGVVGAVLWHRRREDHDMWNDKTAKQTVVEISKMGKDLDSSRPGSPDVDSKPAPIEDDDSSSSSSSYDIMQTPERVVPPVAAFVVADPDDQTDYDDGFKMQGESILEGQAGRGLHDDSDQSV